MKTLESGMLIQDMNLKIGDRIKIDDFIYEYAGTTEVNGKVYDKVAPINPVTLWYARS